MPLGAAALSTVGARFGTLSRTTVNCTSIALSRTESDKHGCPSAWGSPVARIACGGAFPCSAYGRNDRISKSAKWSATSWGVHCPPGRYHVDKWWTEPKW